MLENDTRFASCSRRVVRFRTTEIKISWHTGLTRCEKIARHLRDYLSIACARVRVTLSRIIGESHRCRCHEIGVSGLNANERFVYNEHRAYKHQRRCISDAAPLAATPQYGPRIWHARTLWLAGGCCVVGFSRLACFIPFLPLPLSPLPTSARMYKRAYKRGRCDAKLRTIHMLRGWDDLITRWI